MTVVFKPAQAWWFLIRGLLALFALTFLLCPCLSLMFGAALGERGGIIALFVLFIIAIAIVVEHSWPRLRRSRAVLVSRECVLVSSGRGTLAIPFNQIKSIGRYDMVPGLQTNSAVGHVTLLGYFDSVAEWIACVEVIEAHRSGTPEKIEDILHARFGIGLKPKSPRRGRHPLQIIGLLTFAAPMVATVVMVEILGTRPSKPVAGALVGCYVLGGILALMGTWKSDSRR